MNIDFHSHTTASDGALTPMDVLLRAREQGVEMMAITDHDTVSGYQSVREQWQDDTMQLIAGVELSCLWGRRLIHVVGLNINIDNQLLQQGLAEQQQSRLDRAVLIGDKLAKQGFEGGYAFVAQLAGDSQIGRPHFAQFLVERGHVSSEKEAFKRYLGAGKIGDVKSSWPEMAKVIQWINDSGGVAVLAHPLHYKMTATKLRALVTDFKAQGGAAIEVISGKQPKDRTQYLAQLTEQFDLAASIGSDFHRPGMPWNELGQAGVLPKSCQPVWSVFK
ncbi:PHP domain-containing protein [Oceanicoccus sagamiensis]|uniref:Phosphatase n=1 Tax=Oceanicoccus sagamiensis TaxID=716816 RepID=A0A1X9NGQ3_9GAMM|nr:PHP domain-containing protein [Oceanicoccus sagamiensis]ARN75025.1 phosphatase [Oceanicoccus sagamiensis]